MKFRYSFLLLSVFLSGCAYTFEQSFQDLTIETPGAENSLCYLYIDGLKFRAHPPQTISIPKSFKDMTVDCLAPGNRYKQVIVPSDLSAWIAGDLALGAVPPLVATGPSVPALVAAGAGPAIAWDVASGALFKYPNTILVDFYDVPTKEFAPPDHNSPEIKQSEEYELEEFLPETPRLNSDIGRVTPPIERRVKETGPEYGSDYIMIDDGKDSKSSLKNVINPARAPSPKASDAPAPLYPGQ